MNLAIDGHVIWLPAIALLGAGVGVIAGMFGVGGGFLLIPLMHAVLGVPLPAAVGAGLCTTVANGVGAFLRFRRMGEAELRFDIMLIGGSLLGVDAGTRLLRAFEGSGTVLLGGRSFPLLLLAVTAAYGLVFLVIAALLWWKSNPGDTGTPRPGPLARIALPPRADLPTAGIPAVSGPVIGYVGFANGVLAGFLGIGGGVCLIPIMLYGFGFGIQKTSGTGIVMILSSAVLGTIQHALLGNVHLGLTATLMVSSALAAQVGASLTRRLPTVWLRKGLAVVMILTLLVLVFKLFVS